MKVALDTNVFVAAFATRGLCADVVRAVLADHELVFPAAVRAELRRALAEKLRLPVESIERIDALLDASAVPAEAPRTVTTPTLRDRSDETVLGEVLAAGAEILVSGDRDLLDAASLAPIPIVSPRGFWELLRRSDPPSD